MNAHRPVRARDHVTGNHYTTTRHLAARRGDEVLEDRPAVDKYGAWLPLKENITPARDSHGRFAPVADSAGDIDEPTPGEEEA